ncbi:larval cuticle protein 65Ag1 [Lepeophtheirus salmonis]|uniref:larval cuticle protein 65Ag1 n=1 Tax=Lepeophtheirus salmonis TaxID=72036 RepID=UPI001AEA5E1F|nr:larval cuticle protein 65Ag1-like [Lepeophtheirus salmonis]
MFKMKSFVPSTLLLVTTFLLSSSFAAPQNNNQRSRPPIAILNNRFTAPGTLEGIGNFEYGFETENGIKQEAVGSMTRIGEEDVVTMKGSYEFVGDDGQIYIVTWYADETGFHPSAPHIPQLLRK